MSGDWKCGRVPERRGSGVGAGVALLLTAAMAGCGDGVFGPGGPRGLDPELIAEGKEIFRFDTFGDDAYWTDTLQMHDVIESAVSPQLALQVGLKVDVDALSPEVRNAIAGGQVDLTDPASTLVLLEANAVVGVKGQVEEVDGAKHLTRVGITCALCHSTVDDSFAPGIGKRLDGWPNRDLNVGAIVALSPAVTGELEATLNGWGPGHYDPRINIDGLNTPIVIPPAFGLFDIDLETYTGDGPVSYWNAYVAVTQMHGRGDFVDDRLGIVVDVPDNEDQVTSKLPALREYQLSLAAPEPPAGSFDVAAAARGSVVFRGKGGCASCHLPDQSFTDVNEGILHLPSETGMDPAYAERTANKRYRTTPLAGAWQHPPYFHDGSAATLADVVDHYEEQLSLGLTPQQRNDLIEFLKSL